MSHPDYFVAASLFEVPAAEDEESCQDDHQQDDAHCPVLYRNLKRILKLFCPQLSLLSYSGVCVAFEKKNAFLRNKKQNKTCHCS